MVHSTSTHLFVLEGVWKLPTQVANLFLSIPHFLLVLSFVVPLSMISLLSFVPPMIMLRNIVLILTCNNVGSFFLYMRRPIMTIPNGEPASSLMQIPTNFDLLMSLFVCG